jgi:hypothetical protein
MPRSSYAINTESLGCGGRGYEKFGSLQKFSSFFHSVYEGSQCRRANPLNAEATMTNARLEEILRRLEAGLKGGDGRWQMMREGIPVLVMTDEHHNRMRIIAPAAEVKQVDPEALLKMMEANFVAALDARYAVFKGIVWAAFIHPLDSLVERDLISGLKQVTTLVKTTDTSYSSSELQFGSSYEGKEEKLLRRETAGEGSVNLGQQEMGNVMYGLEKLMSKMRPLIHREVGR